MSLLNKKLSKISINLDVLCNTDQFNFLNKELEDLIIKLKQATINGKSINSIVEYL